MSGTATDVDFACRLCRALVVGRHILARVSRGRRLYPLCLRPLCTSRTSLFDRRLGPAVLHGDIRIASGGRGALRCALHEPRISACHWRRHFTNRTWTRLSAPCSGVDLCARAADSFSPFVQRTNGTALHFSIGVGVLGLSKTAMVGANAPGRTNAHRSAGGIRVCHHGCDNPIASSSLALATGAGRATRALEFCWMGSERHATTLAKQDTFLAARPLALRRRKSI